MKIYNKLTIVSSDIELLGVIVFVNWIEMCHFNFLLLSSIPLMADACLFHPSWMWVPACSRPSWLLQRQSHLLATSLAWLQHLDKLFKVAAGVLDWDVVERHPRDSDSPLVFKESCFSFPQ